MERFFLKVVRHRKLILIIAAFAAVAAVISLFHTNLNSDVARYLPDDSVSKQTIEFLRDNFGINGDAEICAEGTPENYKELTAIVKEIQALDSVSEVQWLGSYDGLFAFEDSKIVSAEKMLLDENVQKMTENLFIEYQGKSYFIITVSLAAANATTEAGEALTDISNILSGYSLPYDLGGNAVQSDSMIKSAMNELPTFIIVALIVIMIILLICSSSVVSALIFLVTIGISIILNMGTNFFTKDISTITFSVAAILQLALSMDYSIFLTHSFETARKTMDDETAMAVAMRKTLVIIAASALTTIAGFIALFAMKYTMGFDLGLCLAKGVTFSFLTVVFVQPCLMLCLKRASDKTAHKSLNPSFKGLSRLPKKLRSAAPLIAAILLIPAVFFSMSLKYYYLDSGFDAEAVGPKAAAQSVGTQSIFAVETVSAEKQLELSEKVKRLDGVSSVTGYYAIIQDLSEGISIPVYSSLEEQNEETLMFNFEPTAGEILAAVEGDRTPIQEKITAKLTNYLTAAAPALIQDAIENEAASLGRPLNEAEQHTLTEGTIAELSQKYRVLIESQLGGLETQLEDFGGQFDEYREKFFAEVDGVEYTFFTAKIAGQSAGQEALETVQGISATAKYVLDTDTVYIAGNTQTVSDLAEVTTIDLVIVSALSALLILIILLFTFKDFLTPILLILVIELAILINLSISTIMGSAINFMSYIIISAIQLGATIDYAILMTKNFRVELENFDPYEAIGRAIKASAFPIIVSMSILCGACLSVYFVSSDDIIREITMLISRGSFISGMMVLFILPAILAVVAKKKNKKAAE